MASFPRRALRWASIFIVLLVGCDSLSQPALPTPLPAEYIPTAVALTAGASGVSSQVSTEAATPSSQSTASGTPSPEISSLPTASATPLPSTPTPTPTGPSPTPYTLPPSPTPTATPEIPNAEIEIRNLGSLSRVTSPLHVYLYLKPGAGGKVLIELLGEDNRLLYRQLRKIDFAPVGAWAVFTVDFDFEIPGVAEAGRLKISVDDEFGRTVALNSVPLILLSVGDADIVPPADVLAPIVIRQPRKKALIQGGKLVVSGQVRSDPDQPLLVKLVTTTGSEVGARLAEVDVPAEGGYGTFVVEVSYTVSQPTPALLVVQQGAATLNDVIHLSSMEVLLSP